MTSPIGCDSSSILYIVRSQHIHIPTRFLPDRACCVSPLTRSRYPPDPHTIYKLLAMSVCGHELVRGSQVSMRVDEAPTCDHTHYPSLLRLNP
jgi:hypothetical protein